jgi:predicted DCC family thiol-disulfide oxidoreductase YuxK
VININHTIKVGSAIVLYDGVCGLCNRFVKFVLSKDRREIFMFASLQSDFAYRLLGKYSADPRDLNSIYVVADYGLPTERVLSKSRAAIFVISQLGGIWTLVKLLNLAPGFLLDAAYRLIASNRYKIFGRYDACLMPDQQTKERFIEI